MPYAQRIFRRDGLAVFEFASHGRTQIRVAKPGVSTENTNSIYFITITPTEPTNHVTITLPDWFLKDWPPKKTE